MNRQGLRLAICADASPEVGTGHVMRCLALAQAWMATGGSATFASQRLPAPLAARISEAGADVVERAGPAGAGAPFAAKAGADWVVLDGYDVTPSDQSAVVDAGLRLLVIDDHGHAATYLADVVLDQNVGADPSAYDDRRAGSKLLLGPQFALLRAEFHPFRGRSRIAGPVRKVFVALGGSPDPDALHAVVTGVVAALPDGAEVVLAPGVISATGDAFQGVPVRIATGAGLAPAMATADLAVTAAGSTVWELAFLGVPSLLVTVADNQRPLATRLAACGAGIDLGWSGDLTVESVRLAVSAAVADLSHRVFMVQASQALVDGYGADRVVVILRQATMRIREATPDDASLLWRWANDPGTRRSAFSGEPIAWEEHVSWLETRLADPATSIYLAEDEVGPVGQIRFQRSEGSDSVDVDMSVAPERRGRRLGASLVAAGTDRFFADAGADAAGAVVKAENTASIRAFSLAGYERTGDGLEQGSAVVRFRRSRPGQ